MSLAPRGQSKRPDHHETTGYLGLLGRNRPFRYLWLGKVVSLAGSWFNTIALYEAVQTLTTSALAVTLVLVAKTLPIFVMTPLSGPLVDRFDRRVLLIASDLLRALCCVSLIAAHWMDWLPGLYLGSVVLMLGTGIALPATSAALPMIVPARRIPMANALLGGTWSIMLAVGAALGGLATHALGVGVAFAIDAGTFLGSALLFACLPPLPAPAAHAPGYSHKTGFRDGLRYLGEQPYVLCLAALKPMMQLFGGLLSILPLYGSVVYKDASGALFVGILYAVRGLGAMIGSLVLRAIFGDSTVVLRRLILGCYALCGLAYCLLAFSTTYWQAALSFFLAAIGGSAIWVFSGSLIQLEADRRFHGRVFSMEAGVAMLVLATSSTVAGAALDAGVALSRAVLVFAALSLIPIAVWGLVIGTKARTHGRAGR